jgi:hypothetical protein
MLAAALLLADGARAAEWQLSGGPTLEEGGTLELARHSRGWELALGVVSRQRVRINYISPDCPYEGAPTDICGVQVRRTMEEVSPYAYFSVQRRFAFRDGRRVRPLLGIGLVGTTDTNEYVSTPLNLSLSAGLALGQQLSLEWRHFSNADVQRPNLGQDAVLLRWRFR